MGERVPTYFECLEELQNQAAEQGALGLIVFDAGCLAEVEREYGAAAYGEVRQRALGVLEEQRGKDYRGADVVALERPQSLRFLLFLGPRRRRDVPVGPAELRAARQRLSVSLAPALGRASFPYRKSAPRVETGAALLLHNPLMQMGSLIERGLAEAARNASFYRLADEAQQRERLQDVIVHERIVSAYQPIVMLANRSITGHEALTRGQRGCGLEGADALFRAAEEQGLMLELDSLCRRKALLNSSHLPASTALFINTLPATIRDPQFRGRPLIDFLDRARVAPQRIVLEITERLMIDNYSLFREAMAYYTDLGMRFAVDDVGAGYSGLESIARLKPHFLKIDVSLVRDLHVSAINREMVKAIVSLGRGIGATVIAEGIQAAEEVQALQQLGVDLGQGFHLAPPALPSEG